MQTKDFESVKTAKRVAIAQLDFYNEMMNRKMKKQILLRLTERQFLVLNEFLFNTKLGDRNAFESEISDLAIELDTDDGKSIVRRCVKNCGLPKISAVLDEDGFSFTVS